MRFITLFCSGISSAVLYVVTLFMVAVSWLYGTIGIALETATNIVDYHLGGQLDLFEEALNGKQNRKKLK